MIKTLSYACGALLLALGLLLTACQPAPDRGYVLGELLLDEDFSQAFDWRSYLGPGVDVAVVEGRYRGIVDGGQYVWGINSRMHEDAVLEVETQLTSGDRGNSYGVICRADPNNDGDGYYFLIGADGTYSIRKGIGDEVLPLVHWARSPAVRTGAGSSNTIRAVCIGEYLAMYVNGQFVASTRDDDYSRGFAGLAFVSLEGETLYVEYDNLKVWQSFLTGGD